MNGGKVALGGGLLVFSILNGIPLDEFLLAPIAIGVILEGLDE